MRRWWVLAVCLGASGAAIAGEPLVVFGVPLGGVVKPANCPAGSYRGEVLCWVKRPTNVEGWKQGSARLPDSSVPLWAVGVLPSVRQTPAERLAEVKLSPLRESDGKAAAASIRQRFGLPTSAGRHDTTWWNTWLLPAGENIVLACSDGLCSVAFRSAELVDILDRERATRPARPATP